MMEIFAGFVIVVLVTAFVALVAAVGSFVHDMIEGIGVARFSLVLVAFAGCVFAVLGILYGIGWLATYFGVIRPL